MRRRPVPWSVTGGAVVTRPRPEDDETRGSSSRGGRTQPRGGVRVTKAPAPWKALVAMRLEGDCVSPTPVPRLCCTGGGDSTGTPSIDTFGVNANTFRQKILLFRVKSHRACQIVAATVLATAESEFASCRATSSFFSHRTSVTGPTPAARHPRRRFEPVPRQETSFPGWCWRSARRWSSATSSPCCAPGRRGHR